MQKSKTPCELGIGVKPNLRRGTYLVRRVSAAEGNFGLFFSSARSEEVQLQGTWNHTTGITVHGRWLYIISEGKLHRVDPETGCHYPRDFAVCGDWYVGWPGPIWSDGGHLYAIRHDGTNERRIERLDFDRGKSKVVQKFYHDSVAAR